MSETATETREFARYKYRSSATTFNPLVAVAVVATIAALVAMRATPWALTLLVIPLVIVIRLVRAGSNNLLLIGSRYVIVGSGIVYYQNIARVHLDRERRTLTLTSSRGNTLVLAAERFPTNARKPDKIRLNTGAKFDKAVEKILQRLKEINPDVVV